MYNKFLKKAKDFFKIRYKKKKKSSLLMNSEARSKEDLYKNNKGIGSVSFTMEDIKCLSLTCLSLKCCPSQQSICNYEMSSLKIYH